MYWEDKEPPRARPPYLDLCLGTVQRHLGPLSLEVVDRGSIFSWLDDLDPVTWARLPGPTFRSDYGRTRLLHRYGGLYLDFDCIVVDALPRLLEPLDRVDFAGWGREAQGRFYNNLFAARPGARFLEEWVEAQDRVLEGAEDWFRLPRAVLGQDLAAPIAARVPHHNYPLATIAPVMWYEWRRFFSTMASPAQVLAGMPATVMLWNGYMGRPLRNVSTEDLRQGRTLLSRLLRIGLGESKPEEELDWWTRLHVLSDVRFSTVGRYVARRVGDPR